MQNAESAHGERPSTKDSPKQDSSAMVNPKTWAILIGINFYTDYPKLEGTINDVTNMTLYLEESGRESLRLSAFTATTSSDPHGISPTEDESVWPTYENITSKLKDITRDSSPGDFVYFQFSGHGARKPADSAGYSEQDNSDIALVLFNKDELHPSQGSRYLRGLELARLLEDMVKKGLILTIVLDCCHSGSITRGPISSMIREVDWDDSVDAAYPPAALIESPPLARDLPVQRNAYWKFDWLQNHRLFTLLTACSPLEISYEIRDTYEIRHGALSYFLVLSLRDMQRVRREVKIQSLFDRICAKFIAQWDKQYPMLLGNRDVSFLGSTCPPTAEYIHVFRTEDGNLSLSAGHAHGVCENDEYDVYPEALPDFEQTSRDHGPVRARATTVRGVDSDLAEIETASGQLRIRTGWMARPVTHFSTQPVYVKLLDLASHEGEWKALLEGNPIVRLFTDSSSVAKLRLYHIRLNNRSEYEILNSLYEAIENVPTVPITNGDSAIHVIRMVEQIAQYKLVKSLENPFPSLALQKSFEIDFGDNADGEGRIMIKDSGVLRMRFRNTSKSPLYFSLYNLNPNWEIKQLSGEGGGADYFVIQSKDSDSESKKPGTMELPIRMSIPEELKRAGRNYCEDVLKVFVTVQATSFRFLRLGELGAPGTRSGSSTGFDLCQLSGSLANLAVPHRGRTHETEIDRADWIIKKYIIRTVTEDSGGMERA